MCVNELEAGFFFSLKGRGAAAGAEDDLMVRGARESSVELLNSCYLKRSGRDRRGGGAYTARSEHLGFRSELNMSGNYL